jgi:hypothetical protein
MSPAEIRDVLGLKDQCMVFFGGGEISIAPGGSMTFWEPARFAKDGLSAVKSTENISRTISNPQPSPTTLGRLPFDSTFGPPKLESLWAPCAQTLGAVTVNGSLHLTHTSPAPISGLLAGVQEELRKACAV